FWQVRDVEAEVAELKARGVKFEEYDLPGGAMKNSIIEAGGAKTAWFKDTEGKILAGSPRPLAPSGSNPIRRRSGSYVERVPERRLREQARGVESREGRFLGTNEQRDLGAREGHGIAAVGAEAADDLVVEAARIVGEDAVHELGEDDAVHILGIGSVRDD